MFIKKPKTCINRKCKHISTCSESPIKGKIKLKIICPKNQQTA